MAREQSISVVLVCYNQEDYIEEAVRAILGQVCPAIDILISDDCSSDRTFDIVQKTVADYQGPHRVRLNRNGCNMGISAHYTNCVLMMDTDWVVGAAGDDVSHPSRVSAIAGIIRSHPHIDGVGSDVKVIDQHGRIVQSGSSMRRTLRRLKRLLKRSMFTDQHLSREERLRRFLINGLPWLNGATAAWRRRLITDYPAISPDAPEDAVLRMRAAIGGGVCISKERLVKYRMHTSNAWNTVVDGLTPEQLETRRRRQLAIGSAAIAQHAYDLETVAREHQSPTPFSEGLALLRLKQALAEYEIHPKHDAGDSLSRYLVRLAVLLRESSRR